MKLIIQLQKSSITPTNHLLIFNIRYQRTLLYLRTECTVWTWCKLLYREIRCTCTFCCKKKKEFYLYFSTHWGETSPVFNPSRSWGSFHLTFSMLTSRIPVQLQIELKQNGLKGEAEQEGCTGGIIWSKLKGNQTELWCVWTHQGIQ